MYKINSEGYVILAQSKVPPFDVFLEVMGVSPNKFASKVLQFIYSEIYLSSKDLKYEYINYYSIEYDSLEKYLHNMVGINIEDIDLEKEHLFYFQSWSQIMDLAYDDNYLDTILRILERNDEN